MANLAHKIRLYPNNKQATLLSKTVGVARFAFNLALSWWKVEYENGGKPNEANLRKRLNQVKYQDYPWMLEVSKCSIQQAIKNVGRAFQNFFKKIGQYPKFKKKGIHDSAYFDNCQFYLKGKYIHLAKVGKVRLAERLRFEGKLMSATISREADQWYVSIQVETEVKQLDKTNSNDGVDVGVQQYNSVTTESTVPRSYRSKSRKLRRLQQYLSRKQIGSNNRQKAKTKVARCHLRIRNIRQDWLHKYTTDLVRNNDVIGIENLNIRGMLRNKRLAKSITDASFGEFRRQLEYKAALYGRTIVVIPRFFPSSKLCNRCLTKTKKMSLSVRSWKCENCGEVHDRDRNAAINIRNYALEASSALSACGVFSPLGHLLVVDDLSPTVKQELNLKFTAT